MDPFTAICNAVTAYITFATARFNAAPAAQQAEIGTVDAAIIKTMYDDMMKVRADLEGWASKLPWNHPSAPPKTS